MVKDNETPELFATRQPENSPLVLKMPIDVRSTSLAVLAVLAVIVFMYWARVVFIPITVSILASYALTPVVNWLKRKAKLPKVVGAGLTLVLILTGLGAGLQSLQPETIEIIDMVSHASTKFSSAIRRKTYQAPTAIEKMKAAATEIEKAANAAAIAATNSGRSPVTATEASAVSAFHVQNYLMMGTASAIAGIGQLVVIVALVYFLLVAGDTFRRSLVRISGDTLSKKKITVQILDEIDAQIQRYLLVQVATSALLGVVMWAVFAWTGLDNAFFWGCAGAVLHLIPYVGPTAFLVIVTLVAYVQFDSLQPVAFVVISTLVIVSVIGLLLVPWLTQRLGRLNAVTVFLSLLFWGWLWGVWGLLLGVPIVMAVNAVCERVEGLNVISEFLGYTPKKPKDERSLETSPT